MFWEPTLKVSRQTYTVKTFLAIILLYLFIYLLVSYRPGFYTYVIEHGLQLVSSSFTFAMLSYHCMPVCLIYVV